MGLFSWLPAMASAAFGPHGAQGQGREEHAAPTPHPGTDPHHHGTNPALDKAHDVTRTYENVEIFKLVPSS